MGEIGGQRIPSLFQTCSPVSTFIQNQRLAGTLAKSWDKTGIIIENHEHDKNLVKVDGSGRVTQKNRRLLLPGTILDACLSRPLLSSPPVTSTCGACQVKNYDKEHDDRIDDHAPAPRVKMEKSTSECPISNFLAQIL